jgi:hypothetical protein
MREDMSTVLCPAILKVVDAGFEEICELYVDRAENPGDLVR